MVNEREPQVSAEAEGTSHADFLVNLGNTLREKENIDTDLAEILAKHLLSAKLAADAVATAKDAIVKLAVARANAPMTEAGEG